MDKDHERLSSLVVELIELTRVDSQFADSLFAGHRRRLVASLLRGGKIDQDTADYLLS